VISIPLYFPYPFTTPRGIGRKGRTKKEIQEISTRRRSCFFLGMKGFVIDGGTYTRAGTTRSYAVGEERRCWNGCTRRRGLPGKSAGKETTLMSIQRLTLSESLLIHPSSESCE
jgi:hypothetical protein